MILSAIVYVLARASGSSSCPPVAPTVEFTTTNVARDVPLSASKPATDFSNFDIGAYRAQILARTPPHIIECAEADEGGSQEACHLPRDKRFAALDQKGVTLWMTGLSGSGKSTIASLLEEQLVSLHGKSVYRLDGDNIRTGLNRDLGFSKDDRAESVRRVGELACLFNDAGTITIVSLVSPYRADRDEVRRRHEQQGLKFLEVFMDVPLSVVQERDPKGLYEKVAKGEIKGFTGVDDPYEAPENAEIVLANQHMSIQASVDAIMLELMRQGVLVGAPTSKNGLPYPDGDELIDLTVPASLRSQRFQEALKLPRVLLSDIDVNWLQTVAEGYAAPLKGFMREGTLLQTIHFNSLLVDPYNLTGNKAIHESKTDFLGFNRTVAPKRVSMSVPIVLAATDYTKMVIDGSKQSSVTLSNKFGRPLAILRNVEIYANRKEEILARIFGVIDPGHPYIEYFNRGGPWLLGGEIELLERIQYHDGLDRFRLNAQEVRQAFEDMNADAVFAFQTRNPTHAGHAYLMRTSRDILLKKGFRNPVLWLSPLGGWTKSDDVPLDVRVKQHEAVLQEQMLDPKTTVMAIWPAPMIYAGPTEVLFHAKSRRNAGATYFVAGRDPAGMKGSSLAVAHPDDDLYNGDHGRYVLYNSPGQSPLTILPFAPVSYDKRDHTMKAKDPRRPDDFIDISGSKMRKLAAQGAVPCDVSHGKDIPSDLVAANCIPPGFMVESGWKIVSRYYQQVESEEWVPFSQTHEVHPHISSSAILKGGEFGTLHAQIYLTSKWSSNLKKKSSVHHYSFFNSAEDKMDGADEDNSRVMTTLQGGASIISPWHDIPLVASSGSTPLFHMVVEIPMYSTAKMEMQKSVEGNPLMQDSKNKQPRFYSYGSPIFNYGFLPQTWEDPTHVDTISGTRGDSDPIDVVELGSQGPLAMGEVVTVKVLGSLALIDEGETDHKIIALRSTDPDFARVNSMDDLEKLRPGVTALLVDWMKNYKTTEGKGVNRLQQEEPTSVEQALNLIEEVYQFYRKLIEGVTPSPEEYALPVITKMSMKSPSLSASTAALVAAAEDSE